MSFLDDISCASRFKDIGATKDYFSEVDESISEINAQRPLSPDIVQRLNEEILYDRVHGSAAVEGNPLTRRETIVVLTSGLLEAGRRKATQEVRNLADACIYLQECLDRNESLTVTLLQELHQKLLFSLDDQNAGRFRDHDVAISGASFSPPSHIEVPQLVRHVIDLCTSSGSHPIQNAAFLHWAIARIHPYRDANGRLARLLQDFVLLRARYVPAPIQPEDREKNYYDALEEADAGDGASLMEIVAKNTLRTAEKYLAIIRTEKSKKDWIRQIANAASEKARQTDHRQFLVCQKCSNSIKLEFETLIQELDKELEGISLKLKDYGGLDFDKYQKLKSLGRAPKTWLFGLDIKAAEVHERYIFWHGRHFHNRKEDFKEFEDGVINILVSVEDTAGSYKLLDDMVEDRVTLRELTLDGRNIHRRRYNPITRSSDWDQNIDPSQIASEFINEMFGKLGLI